MADATQNLMLRVQGDNSGADKAVAGTTKAIERLHISGQKAGAVFKNFSRSLSEARNASDVASAAADSLSHILGKTLGGAIAIGGFKIFSDQIERMGQMLKDTATAAQKAFDDIEKAGKAMNLDEANAQVSQLDSFILSTDNKLKELNRSPFQNFIAEATGARKQLEALVKTNKKLRDSKLAEGIISQNLNDELLDGLDAESKKLYEIDAQYRKRSKIAETITNPQEYEAFQKASGDIMARERNALLDKMAKDRRDSDFKFARQVYAQEVKLDKDAADRSEKLRQELIDRRIANQNSASKEEMYDIEENARLEAKLDQNRFDRLMRDAKRVREEQKKYAENEQKYGGGLLGASQAGRQALETAQKQRAEKVRQENFKAQDVYFSEQAKAESARTGTRVTAQDMRVREAQRVSAANMPTLAEQAQAQAQGFTPEQVAIANVAQKQTGGGWLKDLPNQSLDWSNGGASKQQGQNVSGGKGGLMETLNSILQSLSSAPLVTSGAGGSK